MHVTETKLSKAYDQAYTDAVDAVTAAMLCTDRIMIARLAGNPDELSRIASILARPGNGEVGLLTYRGWLAGFNAAVITACRNIEFARRVSSANNRYIEITTGIGAGYWLACSACADSGQQYRNGGAVGCGYCSAGLPVARRQSDIRAFLDTKLAQERSKGVSSNG
jgi:hypothetical protein